MQAGLAFLSAALGVWSWVEVGDACLLIGALLILAVVPFTLFVIMPTNKRLLTMRRQGADAEARVLLVRWGKLHWVRNLLGAAAVATFLACLVAR